MFPAAATTVAVYLRRSKKIARFPVVSMTILFGDGNRIFIFRTECSNMSLKASCRRRRTQVGVIFTAPATSWKMMLAPWPQHREPLLRRFSDLDAIAVSRVDNVAILGSPRVPIPVAMRCALWAFLVSDVVCGAYRGIFCGTFHVPTARGGGVVIDVGLDSGIDAPTKNCGGG